MPPDFDARLRLLAEVIVRVGLNLQRGQRLLIAEPYELQGVSREAQPLVDTITQVAGVRTEVIWGDAPRLRQWVKRGDWPALAELTAAHAAKMDSAVRNGDALLFLLGSHPTLLNGLPGEDVAELRRIAGENFGPVAHQLTRARAATNWTAAPAPNTAWADQAYPELPAAERLAALWGDVFAALRVDQPDSLVAWQIHLDQLTELQSSLNQRRHTTMRYHGPGTALTVTLPADHHWCTARLKTRFGVPFVANLPTEEVFTAPHRDSAEGHLRVARPVYYAGSLIEGLELEFAQGKVVSARARAGQALVETLLATDPGAIRLGEVAYVPRDSALARSTRVFGHTLLDENAASHVALGQAYPFCLRSPDGAADVLNHSLLHLDLPLDASVTWEPA